ncbi:acyl-CoA transferase [Arthrobacter psychrolactophilus]|uniref:Acyl-CoA transferase n=1 Tax=Arthrobacter psychrolactophilus TaxID=92442 RepID=A0A2V5IP16_9MICC|nr:CoA transferase [Arthrobacter psychrolactophilus]PYI38305.1 acyl-CoA transferase [Arthrobacter psychrolactophilus]
MNITGEGTLPSAFDVTGLAVTALSEAASAVALLAQRHGAESPEITVNRDLASLWFAGSFTPLGWELPPVWDAIAGDYRCLDGWIRLHTNAPHHRAAVLKVLGLEGDVSREEVMAAVVLWEGQALEDAVVAANGCAALLRSPQEWREHPQGRAVASEPLIGWGDPRAVLALQDGEASAQRPLAGVRVLDLTRIIAGPVATRFLAFYGAEVLRIDPPCWDEPSLEAELTIGKRCARLDLKSAAGLVELHELLAGADIFIHGYRADALDALGLSDAELAARYPSLINVALNAYGWSGQWANRRGFDSLVQMSCGIAYAGRAYFAQGGGLEDLSELKPHPLPVQALDHATGYLCAAAAVTAWGERLEGTVRNARLSLARTAVELMGSEPSDPDAPAPHVDGSLLLAEDTVWGPGQRLPSAVQITGVVSETDIPAQGLGWAEPHWL